jgi:hypothetical protein
VPAGATVPAVADRFHPADDALIACIGSEPMNGRLFSHWQVIALNTALDEEVALDQTMRFLISAVWMTLEARERGVTVSDRAVRRKFLRDKRASFDSEAEFQRFLKETGFTVADLKYRERLDLLSNGVRNVVMGRGSPRVQRHRLNVFVRRFTAKWRAGTACLPAYAIPDCGTTFQVAAPPAAPPVSARRIDARW